MLRFGIHTSGIRFTEIDDQGLEGRPSVFLAYQGQYFVLTEVFQEYVIMFVLKYLEPKVISFRNINLAI